jgi:hypothetical protein
MTDTRLLSTEAVSKRDEICRRPRGAKLFGFFPLQRGLRARKSEQNGIV